jgi:hypothetical protein
LPSEVKAAILLRAPDEPPGGEERRFPEFSRIGVNFSPLRDRRPKSWAGFAQKYDVLLEINRSPEKSTTPVIEVWDKLGRQAATFRPGFAEKSRIEFGVVLELQTRFHQIIMEHAGSFDFPNLSACSWLRTGEAIETRGKDGLIQLPGSIVRFSRSRRDVETICSP